MKKLNCILLIDDDESTNRFHEIIIKQSNLTDIIVKAKNGKEALGFLTSHKNRIEPNLIFLDLNMPVIDGFRFLEKYQKTKEFEAVKPKIIILTTSLIPEEKSNALANKNIYKFLNKPMKKNELKSLMTELQFS